MVNGSRNTLIHLDFDMPAQFIYSNPKVSADIGKLPVVKGPVFYCLEEIDNGKNLSVIEINNNTKLIENYEKDLLGGTLTILASAEKVIEVCSNNELYNIEKPKTRPVTLKFIPYCLWNSRGKGEMLVWVSYKN